MNSLRCKLTPLSPAPNPELQEQHLRSSKETLVFCNSYLYRFNTFLVCESSQLHRHQLIMAPPTLAISPSSDKQSKVKQSKARRVARCWGDRLIHSTSSKEQLGRSLHPFVFFHSGRLSCDAARQRWSVGDTTREPSREERYIAEDHCVEQRWTNPDAASSGGFL